MQKRFFYMLLLLVYSATIIDSAPSPISPDTTVFAFDLHEVLMRKQPLRMAWLSVVTFCKGLGLYAFNPWFWGHTRTCYASSSNLEYVFNCLIKQYPGLEQYKKDFYRIYNTYEPIASSVELVNRLRAQGYKLYILSNIGTELYQDLVQKQGPFLSNFAGVYTSGPHNKYIGKPEVSFYRQFREYLITQNEGNKQIIFIDDASKNIQGALLSNTPEGPSPFVGIRYTGSRSVYTALEQLGLIFAPLSCNL